MVKKINELIDKILTKLKLIKYKELIMYLFSGGGATVVDWGVFALFVLFIPPVDMGEFINSISPNFIAYCISWFMAVLFAYFFSKLFVFEETGESFVKQFTKFFFSRFLTLVFSIVGDAVLCGDLTNLKLQPFVGKLIISIVVIIVNYITSKLLVFKKGKDVEDGQH
ncbi:MAG: GtrA family protein [Clostridia bacterium]|nr:GtrA family protein [Clostridia bacterium]